MIKSFNIAKQYIYDENRKVIGYELLYRGKCENYFLASSIIFNFALQNLTEQKDKFIFINVDEDFLFSDLTNLEFVKNTIVFELMEDIKISHRLIKKLIDLRENKGFKISINNFDYLKHAEILNYLDFVKINIMDDDKIFKNISIITQSKIKSIAFKVENEVFYKIAKKLGFNLFQGYYFCLPQEESWEMNSIDENLIIKILNLVIRKEDIKVIEDYFKLSPDFLLNLLVYINSAYFGFKAKIGSVKRAISFMGYKNLEKWLLFQLFFSKKEYLIFFEKATFRGKILEYVTQDLFPEVSEKAFLTGMLSVFNKKEIFHKIELDNDITAAIEKREGILGELLMLLEKAEDNDFENIDHIMDKYSLNLKKLMEYELKAISWFETLKDEIKNVR